ncbi:MAG: orotidine-5'-phosphate decarboxylase [Candidatus Omnitrophota bacterium]|jgi:orotidine-5'-phosphate decarboxylase
MKQAPRIILALDVDNFAKAKYFVNKLYPEIKIFKVGLQLFTACGPEIIKFIRGKGARVFLDLKFNDIPNTMANAAKEALRQKVAMFTVHTLAGPTALKEVATACKGSKTKVLGVTILTSICGHFLKDLGIQRSLPAEVLYLARMAKRSGLDGVVCSVEEAGLLRRKLGRNFIIVTPGIRPLSKGADDQKRTASARQAIAAGSDFLVVGRPILKAEDPLKALDGLLI